MFDETPKVLTTSATVMPFGITHRAAWAVPLEEEVSETVAYVKREIVW
ncbi:hypothetical protein RISK_003625 [Rhodopirellula islandica]|uniref:Uncharacterized protein n=1 Tax=Rhodopirellula islandica TaxID=595434 RepID=A0A0J1BDJ7_RHOIS|nr:hypothetical protein RISK_003625 [Rhodopirellula islandica]